MNVNTRSRSQIYLVGTEYSQILGAKLPSVKQVLSVFFYNHNIGRMTKHESARLAIREVSLFWLKCRIPIKDEHHSITKLEKLHQEWISICKNKNRRNPGQITREKEFVESLNTLFDIAHADALNTMKDEVDKQFLINQRQKGRPGCIAGVDTKTLQQAKRKSEVLEADEARRQKSARKTELELGAFNTLDLSFSGSGSTSEGKKQSDSDSAVPSTSTTAPPFSRVTRLTKRAKKTILNERVLTAFDKYKVSDRGIMHIISALLDALNIDMENIILNRTSIQQQRKLTRKKRATEIKNNFEIQHGVVHWDGKLLPEITGKEKVDRLPVYVSGINGEQLLGIPGLSSSTGTEMADAIYELLIDWNVENNIVACCFDTTASNTGRLNGAGTLLEQKLEKSLLYLPCRHHIYEVILRGVFETELPGTSGKDVPLFKRFESNWKNIKKDEYKNMLENERLKEILIDVKDDITNFCNKQLKKPICRDDYRELLILTTVALGTCTKVTFRDPGPMHHARWMSKAIYSIKIYLFRDQFNLTPSEESKLANICAFIIRFYVKAWFKCPIAPEAAYQDYCFLKDLYEYRNVNANISQIAIKKMSNHLWYFADENIGLSLFDENIPLETKKKMSDRIKRFISIDENEDECDIDAEPDDVSRDAVKRIPLKPEEIEEFLEKPFEHWITINTLEFFERFDISTDFLYLSPDGWKFNDNYKQASKLFYELRTVNDTAERGVKLFEEYNKILTKDENMKQYLLQVIVDYKKKFPTYTKTSLTIQKK